MKLIKLTCSNCNAHLEIDIDKLQAYCPHCGQKLLFDLDQMEVVLAEKEKTKRAQEITKQSQEKTKREQEVTRRSQIEYEYKDKEARRNDSSIWFGIIVLILIAIGCFGLSSYYEYADSQKHSINNEIQVSVSSKDLKKESAENAVRILENVGFKNVEMDNKEDLLVGLFSKEGEIISVTINGDSSFSESDWFPADAVVIITYHGFKEK